MNTTWYLVGCLTGFLAVAGCGDDTSDAATSSGGGGGGTSSTTSTATGLTSSTGDATSTTGAGGQDEPLTPVIVHDGGGIARNLVARGGYVYFGQPTSDVDQFGAIMRVPVEGGTPTTVVVEADRFFAASDTTLFYQELGQLIARPHDGGSPEVIAEGDHELTDLEGMLHADGFVYRAHEGFINGPNPDALSRTEVATGDVEDLAVDEAVAGAFFGMPAWAVGSGVLAWGRSAGGVGSVATAGGDVDVHGTGGVEVTAIGVDGASIVAVLSEAFGGRLVRIEDGTEETLYDDPDGELDLDFPYSMHVTGSWIWVGVGGGILRFSRDGGEPTVIPTGGTVAWITSDGPDVYWLENYPATGGIRIQRLAE